MIGIYKKENGGMKEPASLLAAITAEHVLGIYLPWSLRGQMPVL